jgi:DNA-binding IclR family transcriptional regulator
VESAAKAPPSPPTDRVVAIIELLAGADGPLRISDIIEQLGISRSTCAAILETLAQRGWVERLADLSFQTGSGLIPVANAIRAQQPILHLGESIIEALVADLPVESVGLSLIDGGYTTRVARAGTGTWVSVGPVLRLPIFPPFGAVAVAFGSKRQQARWLDHVGDDATRSQLATFLEVVRKEGVAVWRLDAQTQYVAEAILATHAFAADSRSPRIDGQHGRQATLLHALSRSGYTAEEVRDSASLPISYIATPVFDQSSRPCYELEAHVLRTIARKDYQRIIDRLKEASNELTVACGGAARPLA